MSVVETQNGSHTTTELIDVIRKGDKISHRVMQEIANRLEELSAQCGYMIRVFAHLSDGDDSFECCPHCGWLGKPNEVDRTISGQRICPDCRKRGETVSTEWYPYELLADKIVDRVTHALQND